MRHVPFNLGFGDANERIEGKISLLRYERL